MPASTSALALVPVAEVSASTPVRPPAAAAEATALERMYATPAARMLGAVAPTPSPAVPTPPPAAELVSSTVSSPPATVDDTADALHPQVRAWQLYKEVLKIILDDLSAHAAAPPASNQQQQQQQQQQQSLSFSNAHAQAAAASARSAAMRAALAQLGDLVTKHGAAASSPTVVDVAPAPAAHPASSALLTGSVVLSRIGAEQPVGALAEWPLVRPESGNAVTLYAFEGMVQHGEVSFRAGERVLITNDKHEQWWYGTVLSTASCGWFPKSYVECDRPHSPKAPAPGLPVLDAQAVSWLRSTEHDLHEPASRVVSDLVAALTAGTVSAAEIMKAAETQDDSGALLHLLASIQRSATNANMAVGSGSDGGSAVSQGPSMPTASAIVLASAPLDAHLPSTGRASSPEAPRLSAVVGAGGCSCSLVDSVSCISTFSFLLCARLLEGTNAGVAVLRVAGVDRAGVSAGVSSLECAAPFTMGDVGAV
ncbi:MAG: hypothetical protein EOO41_02920, partial [Methanobacteriota archaeon]